MNLKAAKWAGEFEKELKAVYCITIADTGWEASELHERYGELEPSVAVDQFGEKYGLRAKR